MTHWTAGRARRVLCLGLLAAMTLAVTPALAAVDCPGNPDALGTSRTIVVDPREHPRIGTMQYPETLPLRDHEVVLTFDDGPIPKYSNQILDILAAQCVKATFFEIGMMARQYPANVRKLIAAGHTVGTHTQTHPLTMNRMPIERARAEIDDGIASVTAALGEDSSQLSPFLRIPGLMRATVVEDYLASKGIQTWSADFPADDWRHISSQKVHDLAISRITAKGKGILLLHDIQARTVAALPRILSDLKAGGFRIVHVVAATPDLPKTPTDVQEWQMHPTTETVAISHWQKIPTFTFAESEMLPAPAMSSSDQVMAFPEAFGRKRHGTVPLPETAPWPRDASFEPMTDKAVLPAPDEKLFQIAEHNNAPIRALKALPHQAQQTPAGNGDSIGRLISSEAGASARSIPGSAPVTPPSALPGAVMAR
jgi:peptidoglycan/xylan/chitin deacetylase (PgdA/CDA1 family)